jgi:hypothetical protein
MALDVLYHEKDRAKTLGALWNNRERTWYATDTSKPALLQLFAPHISWLRRVWETRKHVRYLQCTITIEDQVPYVIPTETLRRQLQLPRIHLIRGRYRTSIFDIQANMFSKWLDLIRSSRKAPTTIPSAFIRSTLYMRMNRARSRLDSRRAAHEYAWQQLMNMESMHGVVVYYYTNSQPRILRGKRVGRFNPRYWLCVCGSHTLTTTLITIDHSCTGGCGTFGWRCGNCDRTSEAIEKRCTSCNRIADFEPGMSKVGEAGTKPTDLSATGRFSCME